MEYKKFNFYLRYQQREDKILDLDTGLYYDDVNIDELSLSSKAIRIFTNKNISKVSRLILCTNDLLSFYGFSKEESMEIYDEIASFLSPGYVKKEVNPSDIKASNNEESLDELFNDAVEEKNLVEETKELAEDIDEPIVEDSKPELISTEAKTQKEVKAIFGLSPKAEEILYDNGINSNELLLKLTEAEICHFKGMNISLLREIKAKRSMLLIDDIFADSNKYKKEEIVIKPKEVKKKDEDNKVLLASSDDSSLNNEEPKLKDKYGIKNAELISIGKLNLGVRAYNCLKNASINTIGELLELNKVDLSKIKGMGRKSVKEILDALESLSKFNPEKIKELAANPIDEDPVVELGNGKTIPNVAIEALFTDVRVANALRREKIDTLKDLIKAMPKINNIKNLGQKSIDIIKNKISSLLNQDDSCLWFRVDGDYIVLNGGKRILNKSINQMFNDIRVLNALNNANIKSFSDLLNIRSELNNIKNLGCSSINKINETIEEELNLIVDEDEYLRKNILDTIEITSFDGIKIATLLDRLKSIASEDEILRAIDDLISEGKIFQYEGDKLFFRYPSIAQYIYPLEDLRTRKVLYERLSGKSLEVVGGMFDVTKERIRQIEVKFFKKYMGNPDDPKLFVKEDKYSYLYRTYNFSKKEFIECFNEKERTINYLVMRYDHGDISYEDALNDEKISPRLRVCIEKFLTRDYVFIDGNMIHADRPSILSYFVSAYCRNEQNAEELFEIYNSFIIKNQLDSKFSYDSVRFFISSVSDMENVLTSMHKMVRYYPISSYDFSELLEAINLESFDDLEISTVKVFNDNLDLMKKYDIHNEYELHNLLKRIYSKEENTNIRFKKMPLIQIGDFNRDEYIKSVLMTNGTMSKKELDDYIYENLGLDTIQFNSTYSEVLNKYRTSYAKFSCDNIIELLSDEELKKLSSYMVDDFYDMKDARKIFFNTLGYRNDNKICNANYKKIGYRVYDHYVLNSKYTAKGFFRDILNSNVLDLTMDNWDRYSMFSNMLVTAKKDLDLIEFDKRKLINIKRLNELGITKDDFKEFIAQVKAMIAPDEIFTIYSLKKRGLETKLDDLGFDDKFLDAILASDKSLRCARRENRRIFRNSDKPLNILDFIYKILEDKKAIDLSDLLYLLEDEYDVYEKKDTIIYGMKEYGVYYSSILDRIYLNYQIYYDEV